MARTKGSVNRSTMIKYLAGLGKDEKYLATLPREKVKAIYEQELAKPLAGVPLSKKKNAEWAKLTVVRPPPPPPKPVMVLDKAEADQYYARGMAAIANLKDRYDLDSELDEVPDRIIEHLSTVYKASTAMAAADILRRNEDKFFIHLMTLAAAGKISGSSQQRYSEKRAKQAESLAKYLESKGQTENAAKQRARAAEIRAKMAEYKLQQEAANE